MTSIDLIDDPKALQQLVYDLPGNNRTIETTRIPAVRRSILFKEKAPRKQLLRSLNSVSREERRIAAEVIEALKPYITDEQWLETLQEDTERADRVALDILEALGKEAPDAPLIRASHSPDLYFRPLAQRILLAKTTQWTQEKIAGFIQLCTERLHQHPNSGNRIVAIEMLGAMGEIVTIEAFLPALRDSNSNVRMAALKQLQVHGERGVSLPIEPIVDLLRDPWVGNRWRSLKTLATQADVPVEPLIAMLHDPEEEIVHRAMMILGDRKVVQAIPELVTQLLMEPDDDWPDYTDSAIAAIKGLYTCVPLEPLLDALTNPRELVRFRAITLLSLLKERAPIELLLKLLEHKDPAMRIQAVRALSRHATRIPIKVIVDKLGDRSKKVRKTTSRVLLYHIDMEIPAEQLLPFLDCPENIARKTAIRLLGDRLPLTRLIAATQDHKWSVRVAAIGILGTMGEMVPLDLFLEALCDKNLSIRSAAIRALGEQGERTPIALLVGALHDRKHVNSTAAEVLERLGKRVPRNLLLAALDDPLPYIRIVAIQLLKTIEYEEPFPFGRVRSMLQDSVAEVRLAVIETLNQLEAVEAVEPFIAAINDIDKDVRKAALLALASRETHAPLEPFIATLNDTDSSIRRAALRALTARGERVPLETEKLKDLLADSQTYNCAIELLKKTHMEILREVALEASDILLKKGTGQVLGSFIQENVAETIGNMHNPGPLLVNKLVELQHWPYERVRSKARQALLRLGVEPELGRL